MVSCISVSEDQIKLTLLLTKSLVQYHQYDLDVCQDSKSVRSWRQTNSRCFMSRISCKWRLCHVIHFFPMQTIPKTFEAIHHRIEIHHITRVWRHGLIDQISVDCRGRDLLYKEAWRPSPNAGRECLENHSFQETSLYDSYDQYQKSPHIDESKWSS